MYTAIELRKQNIAEYILYLWQMEDMLRALQFSPEAIYSQLVRPRGLDTAHEQPLLAWYMEIGNLLKSEGKEGRGHLDHTLHLIGDLQKLHEQLHTIPAGELYRELFASVSPELPRLREVVGDDDISDIELCFRALYAAILYRIKGGEESLRMADEVVGHISPAIAELARLFHSAENGKTDLFEGK